MSWFDKVCDIYVNINIFSSCCNKIDDDDLLVHPHRQVDNIKPTLNSVTQSLVFIEYVFNRVITCDNDTIRPNMN